MKMLLSCEPSFVRCIKPNDLKRAMVFDRYLCWQQLKYSGMLETVKIRKTGFAIRYTFEEFLNRYHVIMKDLKIPRSDPREMSEELAKRLLRNVEWTMGNRMIFLKDHHGDILEQARHALLTNAVIVLQRSIKRYLHHRKRNKQTCAAVLIQKSWRGYRDKKAYRKVIKGIIRFQATVKARLSSAKFRRMREDKQRAEQERQQRLERERQQKENEAKLRKAQEEAAAKIQEMFSFITKEEETYAEKEDKAKSASVRKPRETRQDSSSSSLGASLVDGVRRIEQSNDVPALWSNSPSVLSGFGQVAQSSSSDLALTLTALILGLACQGSANEDQETSSPDETKTREPEFVSPLRTKPKGPQGSLRWRSNQS